MEYMRHFDIPQEFDMTNPYTIKSISAVVADMTDNAVYNAIIRSAQDSGVTDLYLMDKKFVADALREKLERENPKPLTIEELRKMDGEPVYVSDLQRPEESEYCIIHADDRYGHGDKYRSAQIGGCECFWYDFETYGERWIAYRTRPKEVPNGK